MTKFKRCLEFCDYDTYYTDQARNRYDSVIPYQRGANWFTNFAKRYAVPALKYLGKQTYKYGKDFIKDVVLGKDIKTSAKTHLKRGASGMLDDLSQEILKSATNPTETKPKAPSLKEHLRELQSEGKTKSQVGSGKKGRKRKVRSQKRTSSKKRAKRSTSLKKFKDIFS